MVRMIMNRGTSRDLRSALTVAKNGISRLNVVADLKTTF